MSKISEVQEQMINYLKENGASYINELYEALNVSKDTFYKALNELESDGTIATFRDGRRRYVKLVAAVPTYLKYVTTISAAVILLAWLSTSSYPFLPVDFGSSNPSKPVLQDPSIIYLLLAFMFGVWVSIVTLREEDLESAYYALKAKLPKLSFKFKR